MATAKKSTKKATSKKTADSSVTKNNASTTEAVQETPKSTPARPKTVMSKEEAQAAKTAAIADAPETKKTINPEGSWPFPTGERP